MKKADLSADWDVKNTHLRLPIDMIFVSFSSDVKGRALQDMQQETLRLVES